MKKNIFFNLFTAVLVSSLISSICPSASQDDSSNLKPEILSINDTCVIIKAKALPQGYHIHALRMDDESYYLGGKAININDSIWRSDISFECNIKYTVSAIFTEDVLIEGPCNGIPNHDYELADAMEYEKIC